MILGERHFHANGPVGDAARTTARREANDGDGVPGPVAITLWRPRRAVRARYRVLPVSLRIAVMAARAVPHPSHHPRPRFAPPGRTSACSPATGIDRARQSPQPLREAHEGRSLAPRPAPTPDVGRLRRAGACSRTHRNGKAAVPRCPGRSTRAHATAYRTRSSATNGEMVGPGCAHGEDGGPTNRGACGTEAASGSSPAAFPPRSIAGCAAGLVSFGLHHHPPPHRRHRIAGASARLGRRQREEQGTCGAVRGERGIRGGPRGRWLGLGLDRVPVRRTPRAPQARSCCLYV